MKATDQRPRAQDVMLGHITGYWISQLVFVAAKLGIADALARGPETPGALAKRLKAHAPSLFRLLRALASVGVFAETPDGRFRLTPTAATLRSDVPGSLRNFATMMCDGYNWSAWGDLLRGVRSGELPFDHVHGVPIFDYLRSHPGEDKMFSESMASISGPENAAVAPATISGDSAPWSMSAARTGTCSPPSFVAIAACAASSTTSRRSSPKPPRAASSARPRSRLAVASREATSSSTCRPVPMHI